ncbi:hypothetical protein [Flavobacterium sp. HNIBRBA15423]|uniref:hypothetical protein n=1 Tax=Flavobacterium sp. HNIBRBA15423 TaxID=3458683 RepID=UPI004044DD4C
MIKNYLKKHELRFFSILTALFLFLPFVKQCDGLSSVSHEQPICLGSETANELKPKITKNRLVFDLMIYFTEESESIIDLCLQSKSFLENDFNSDVKFVDFLFLFSIIFSIILVILTVFGVLFFSLARKQFLSVIFLINSVLVVLILLINGYLFVDRIGQIKIGFYLLLGTNFYLFYHLKKFVKNK